MLSVILIVILNIIRMNVVEDGQGVLENIEKVFGDELRGSFAMFCEIHYALQQYVIITTYT